jgi:hypothetical protein
VAAERYSPISTSNLHRNYDTLPHPQGITPEYQCWDIINVDNIGQDYNLMFPARQHTTTLQSYDLPITTTDKNTYQTSFINLHPHSLPAIFIDQPHIASESGYMKFIYRTRWDFKMDYTLHTQQTANNEYSSSRRIVPYPKAKNGLQQITYITYNFIAFLHIINILKVDYAYWGHHYKKNDALLVPQIMVHWKRVPSIPINIPPMVYHHSFAVPTRITSNWI